jgi:hypothetical protein
MKTMPCLLDRILLIQLGSLQRKHYLLGEKQNYEFFYSYKKIHNFVVAIRRSPQKQQAFSTLSDLVYHENPLIIQLSLVLDVETRWNSTYAMLERALKLRKAFDVYSTTESSVSKYVLSVEEWDKVEMLCKILKPLAEITEDLSKSKYPTLSTVLPYYQGLIEQIVCVTGNGKLNLPTQLFHYLNSFQFNYL